MVPPTSTEKRTFSGAPRLFSISARFV